MKVLVTGFEAFQGEKINSSGLLSKELLGSGSIESLLLPVVYRKAWPCLEQKLEKKSFDFVLMLGQAGGRSKISLERVALNLIDSETPDEEGVQIIETPIEPKEPKAIFHDLPLREWLGKLNQKTSNFEISTTAGTFVCNLVYFQYLLWQQRAKRKTRGLFVHLPYLPEQLSEKPIGTPSMGLDQIKKSILDLLNLI